MKKTIMSIKKCNLITCILQGIILVLLFIPGFFNVKGQMLISGEWLSLDSGNNLSMIYVLNNGMPTRVNFVLLGWLGVISAIVLTTISIVKLLSNGNNKILNIVAFIIPFVETGIFVLYSVCKAVWAVLLVDSDSIRITYRPNYICFVIIALLIALSIHTYVTHRWYSTHSADNASNDLDHILEPQEETMQEDDSLKTY